MTELPTLPERPKAEVYNVGDILTAAANGHLRVPRFQTGLRWKAPQVADLFDSIVRGFPIGGLLLWERPANAEELIFGPAFVSAPACATARYIVDGQQRVTALVGALLHPEERPMGGAHAIWVDLSTGRFEAKQTEPDGRWIPVRILGDRRRLQHWARESTLDSALIDRAFELEEKIIRYEMPAYVVRAASSEALRLIFSRVNSAGVPLKENEVFEALFGRDDQERKPLDALAAGLNSELRFGVLPESWILRCVKSVAGLDPRKSFTEERRVTDAELTRTERALLLAIQFLQLDAGFSHEAVLPYRFPLIVLARFFDLHPQPHPRSRQLLGRWVWRGALTGQHSASSNAAVGAHLADVGRDEHQTLQRLLHRVSRPTRTPDAKTYWYGKAAVTRLYATTLLGLEPQLPQTELPLPLESVADALSRKDLGDLFVPVFGRPEIAARVFLPPGTRKRDLPALPDSVLLSLGIDAAAASSLRAGDEERFIQHRADFLQQRLGALALTRGGIKENDRPPLDYIARSA